MNEGDWGNIEQKIHNFSWLHHGDYIYFVYHYYKNICGLERWHMPVIPAAREAEVGGL